MSWFGLYLLFSFFVNRVSSRTLYRFNYIDCLIDWWDQIQVLHQSENFLAVDKMADLVMNTNPGDQRYCFESIFTLILIWMLLKRFGGIKLLCVCLIWPGVHFQALPLWSDQTPVPASPPARWHQICISVLFCTTCNLQDQINETS